MKPHPHRAKKGSGHEPGESALHDVAVVGAGLVGSAFALGCARARLDVLLVARATPPPPITPPSTPSPAPQEAWDRRVYALSPASKRFLETLKVWQQLDRARISAIYDMRVFSEAESGAEPSGGATGKARASLHFSSYQAGADALAWIVEHRELARVLDTAIAFQHGVTRVDADADGFLMADDHAGVQTARGVLGARLVVGADGARSRVRRQLETLGLKCEVRRYDQTGVVANFACARPHGGTAFQWFTAEGVVALLPLPGQAVALVWSAPDDLAKQLLDESSDSLALRVEAIAGGVLGGLTALGGASGFPLEMLATSRLIAPRFALIGDAAHVVHPLAGQGLNLGLQDADTLCEILRGREVFRECGDSHLLRRYERSRSAPVQAMLHVTDGLHRLFGADDPFARAVRTTGMNLIESFPVIKGLLIRQAMGSAP